MYLCAEPQLSREVILEYVFRKLYSETSRHTLLAQHLVHNLARHVQHTILETSYLKFNMRYEH